VLRLEGVVVAMVNPSAEQLHTRLARLETVAVAFEGIVYRSSTPQFATNTDLLTGEGSRRFGGRWNPVGMAMVYASLSPETAMAETLANNRYYGIPIEDAMPRTFVAIEVRIHALLDLRDGRIRRRLQVSEDRILKVDWRAEVRAGREPITHQVARAIHAGPWEGLFAPSAADTHGHNLLVFPDKLRPESELKLVNAEKLG
jgi:RES domain-containing protein